MTVGGDDSANSYRWCLSSYDRVIAVIGGVRAVMIE